MKVSKSLSFVLAASLVAAPVFAQDSTSKGVGLPGDALDAYDLGEQVNTYVVDLVEFTTSWGTKFGIAPIVKSSLDSTSPQAFFNHLIDAQGLSNSRLRDVPFPYNSYMRWQSQGKGINPNPAVHDPGNILTPSGDTHQMAYTFDEFGGEFFENGNVISGLINIKPNRPKRLWMSRVVAAQNADAALCGLAAIGTGSVEASGTTIFRADDFGVFGPCGPFLPIIGNNVYMVDTTARSNGLLNLLNAAGATDAAATNHVLISSGTTHNTPTIVGAEFAGAPFYMGGNFSTEYVRGFASPPTADMTHLAAGVTDQRGNLSKSLYSFPVLLGSSEYGTAGHIGYDAAGDPVTLNIFGVGVGGAVTGTYSATLPAVVTDNFDGFKNTDLGAGLNEFDHYHSQVAFQGGNGQVAIGKDQQNNMLLAAQVSYPTQGGNDNPLNYIAVAKVDPSTGAATWTMAGYNNGTLDGAGNPVGGNTAKVITDGAGDIVGRMAPLFAVTGGVPLGPSVSAPMIDSVGNVWFLTAAELFKIDGMGMPFSDFDTVLVRAVLDKTTFAYELELIAEVGDTFFGKNSQTDWQIRFLGIADSNSVSSGTAWSGNINQRPHLWVKDICRNSLDADSPLGLGGLILSAQVVYDVDGDGNYETLGDNPATLDQSYNSLLYIGSVQRESNGGGSGGGPLPFHMASITKSICP